MSVFVAVTVTPGSKAPEVSEISPETEALSVWLLAVNALIATQRIEMTAALIFLFKGISPDGGAIGTAPIIDRFHGEVNLRNRPYATKSLSRRERVARASGPGEGYKDDVLSRMDPMPSSRFEVSPPAVQ